jgi:hypothetical protein
MPVDFILPRSIAVMIHWRWFNRPRHPLARLAIGALGLVLVAGMLALGLVALIAFAVIGTAIAIAQALARNNAPRPVVSRPPANVIEGEFVVLPSRTTSIER